MVFQVELLTEISKISNQEIEGGVIYCTKRIYFYIPVRVSCHSVTASFEIICVVIRRCFDTIYADHSLKIIRKYI